MVSATSTMTIEPNVPAITPIVDQSIFNGKRIPEFLALIAPAKQILFYNIPRERASKATLFWQINFAAADPEESPTLRLQSFDALQTFRHKFVRENPIFKCLVDQEKKKE